MSARHPNITQRDIFANDKRVPYNLERTLPSPGTPRATHAADAEHPDAVDERTPYPQLHEMTPLQRVSARPFLLRREPEVLMCVVARLVL